MYPRCEELFGASELWKAVPDVTRREIYHDVVFNLAKKEKEDAKQLRKRNMANLAELLDSMVEITYKTTWQDAQIALLDNLKFSTDAELMGTSFCSKYLDLIFLK